MGNEREIARFPSKRKAALMSIKAYKYRISTNKTTTEKLYEVLNRCQELYNAGLQERRDAYEIKVKRHPNYYDQETRKQLTKEHAISFYEQKRDLVEMKEMLRPEYQEIASHVLQDVLFRLDKAYKRFFQRVKNGEKPGYPRFQGRNRYCSFTYPDGAGWKLDEQTRPPDKKGMVRVNLKLSNIGTVKVHLHQNMMEPSILVIEILILKKHQYLGMEGRVRAMTKVLLLSQHQYFQEIDLGGEEQVT